VAEVQVEGEAGSRRHSVCRLLESRRLEVWSLELVQRKGGGIHMNKGRVGEDRGSKETDGCPLILPPLQKRGITTREARQEVARSALVNGIESKRAALI
jgi:hypothetical protein